MTHWAANLAGLVVEWRALSNAWRKRRGRAREWPRGLMATDADLAVVAVRAAGDLEGDYVAGGELGGAHGG